MTAGPSAPACSRDARRCVVARPERDGREARVFLTKRLQSETAVKLKVRLEKNREKLFTFLKYDGVPWNNNNAEHAVKPFVALRHVIGGITTEKGVRDYLILLSLSETCKYMGVDFLDFLRSREKDIHAFAESRRGQATKERDAASMT